MTSHTPSIETARRCGYRWRRHGHGYLPVAQDSRRVHNVFLRAFTLIETLAATALGSLLMLAILSVLPSIGRARREIAKPQTSETYENLTALIHWDLIHARRLNRGRMVWR